MVKEETKLEHNHESYYLYAPAVNADMIIHEEPIPFPKNIIHVKKMENPEN